MSACRTCLGVGAAGQHRFRRAGQRMMAAAQEPASRQAHPSGFFVLRTPLLPLATVTDWGRGLEAPACAADPAALEAAIAGDRLRLRSRLPEPSTAPAFPHPIFLAP